MAEKDARGVGDRTERERKLDSTPPDDVYPICFSDFSIPCRTVCGHWYCGSCILQLWKYMASSSPCKVPTYSRKINKLMPLDTLKDQQDDDVVKKARQIPFYLKAYVVGVMDPDRPQPHFSEIRIVAMLLSALYMATPFDFIPTGSAILYGFAANIFRKNQLSCVSLTLLLFSCFLFFV